jgi:Ca2+-binding EF-hand superfamily protein
LSLVKGLPKEVVEAFQQLYIDEKGAMTREEFAEVNADYDGIIADDAIRMTIEYSARKKN